MSTVHVFDPANQSDDAEWWATIYTRSFPDYVSHEVVTDVRRQRQGIDHVLTLRDGATVNIDVKTRAKWHDDILLEFWSSEEQRTAGWARKSLHCHYIAYATPSKGFVLLIPFHLLRLALEKNKHKWGKLAADPSSPLREVRALNVGYTTVSVAVPLDEFRRAILDAMRVFLDEGMDDF